MGIAIESDPIRVITGGTLSTRSCEMASTRCCCCEPAGPPLALAVAEEATEPPRSGFSYSSAGSSTAGDGVGDGDASRAANVTVDGRGAAGGDGDGEGGGGEGGGVDSVTETPVTPNGAAAARIEAGGEDAMLETELWRDVTPDCEAAASASARVTPSVTRRRRRPDGAGLLQPSTEAEQDAADVAATIAEQTALERSSRAPGVAVSDEQEAPAKETFV